MSDSLQTWGLMEKALKANFKELTKKELSGLTSKVKKMESYIARNLKEELKIVKLKEGESIEVGTVTGLLHERLPELVKFISLGFNVLLTGSTGSGKTTGAMQAAEALGLDFHSISVGLQTSKSDILGFINANGNYIDTAFRRCYEKGGVFIMDEIDAGNSNVLIVINSALSNGYCAFPDTKIDQHENFKFVATANTFGRGRDLNYVGRNLLDLATLDRFITMQWEYSDKIEKGVREDVREKVIQARKYIQEHKIDGFVSTRTAFSMARLVDNDIPIAIAFEICLYNKFPVNEWRAVLDHLFPGGENVSF